MSASGWLVIYQLGVAECLQNNGITKNPYVRVSGASGGALTVCLMMYGADLKEVRDVLIDKASRVHSDPSLAFSLRSYVLEAMKLVVKDGSYKHPVFQSQRAEIA